MVHTSTILELEQDASGKYIYNPDPDETEVNSNFHFIIDLELALALRSAKSNLITSDAVSLDTMIRIMPNWLKEAIYAISLLADLLINRFMKDGKWVKFSAWRVGWNFTTLIMIFNVAKQVVKACKRPDQ